jgi:Na+/H+ antiporter NhaA
MALAYGPEVTLFSPPAGVAAFLLTLATVDDLGAIAVIAVCFASNLVRIRS